MSITSISRATRPMLAISVLLGGFLTTGVAAARETVDPTIIRSVAARLDSIYLSHGMDGLVGDEKRCYAAAGKRSAGLKLCMLYDMSVKSLDTGIKSYFDTRGGVNPDPSPPYQSDQAFAARMKLDTYYAFHGSVEDATAYFGTAVVNVLRAVADKREMLVRFDTP